MTCAEFEVLLADHVDGTAPGQKLAIEAHLAACESCTALARDAAAAVAFVSRAANVEPPPDLITRILLDPRMAMKRSWERWFGGLLRPRLAAGVAMTALSLAMLARVWMPAEAQVLRAWDRTVKQYETSQLVSEIQAQLDDWTEQP